MLVIVVTGSVGTGKSTVAQSFIHMKKPPFPLWDADASVASLYEAGGEAVEKILSIFPSVSNDSGGIDSKILFALLREKPSNWKILEDIVHPLVKLSMHRFLSKNLKDNSDICVLDIPLLYEGNLEPLADCVIVTAADDDIVAQRLENRGKRSMNKKQLDNIRSRQWSSKAKEDRADYVIYNNTTIEQIDVEVRKILRHMGITF